MIDVATLEGLGARAWPAREVERLGGWELRYADGYSCRVNTVLPWEGSLRGLDGRLGVARAWYGARGLPLRFRVTPLAGVDLPRALGARGFVAADPTLVLVGPLEGERAPAPEVEVRATPEDDWLTLQRAVEGANRRPEAGWRALLGRIGPPVGFGVLRVGDVVGAAGLTVVDGEWAGTFQVVVAPELRRSGLARRLIAGLAAWAAGEGATRGWLQVQESNVAAVRLYRSLWYRTVYRYRYLVEAEGGELGSC